MLDTFTVPSIVDQLINLESRIAVAYERTLKGMPEGRLRLSCSGILRAHRLAAQLLNGRLDGGQSSTQESSLLGDNAPQEPRGLAFLMNQERLVIHQYEAVLDLATLSPATRNLIETALLPEAREHFERLETIRQETADLAAEQERALAVA